MENIMKALESVQNEIEEAKSRRTRFVDREVNLVAVTKTKPKEMVIGAYECGCRHFGENYVNELFEKASDPEILEKCPDIKWHFIGHLQSNKINKLLGTPNLHLLQTVDSTKLADAVNKSWSKLNKHSPLGILVQINVSDEASKSGISITESLKLVEYVVKNCPSLKLAGLMTIGAPNHNSELGPNPDYENLAKICEAAEETLDVECLDLSMGMSDDFVHAIEMGSTCVRVGSRIFGARPVKET